MTDLTVLIWGRILDLWARKATGCSELTGLFYGSLDSRNAERNADNGSLECKVSTKHRLAMLFT